MPRAEGLLVQDGDPFERSPIAGASCIGGMKAVREMEEREPAPGDGDDPCGPFGEFVDGGNPGEAAHGKPDKQDLLIPLLHLSPPARQAPPAGAPAYALRVEYGGKVITYSGDTSPPSLLTR